MGRVLSSNSSMPLPMLFKTRKRRCLVILIAVVCFFVLDCIKMSFQNRTLTSPVQCINDDNKQYIEEMVCDLLSVDLYVVYTMCIYVCISLILKL